MYVGFPAPLARDASRSDSDVGEGICNRLVEHRALGSAKIANYCLREASSLGSCRVANEPAPKRAVRLLDDRFLQMSQLLCRENPRNIVGLGFEKHIEIKEAPFLSALMEDHQLFTSHSRNSQSGQRCELGRYAVTGFIGKTPYLSRQRGIERSRASAAS
jgi:hypothetical protein